MMIDKQGLIAKGLDGRPAPKAIAVARAIARYIMETNWIVGSNIGTEAVLTSRLGVGRKTLHEAVRILEQQSIVRSEPGHAGGLIVKAPALEAFSNSLRTYLEMCGCSLDDVLSVYSPMMHLLLDLALARMTPAHANDLRESLCPPDGAPSSRFEEAMQIAEPVLRIGDIANNQCLTALVYMLHRLVADFAHQEHFPEDLWQATTIVRRRDFQNVVELLTTRNPDVHASFTAMQKKSRDNMAMLETIDPAIWNNTSFLHGSYESTLAHRTTHHKAALALAYRIAAEIRAGDFSGCAKIGTYDELCTRYNASKKTMTEAVRMLEFFGVVRTLKGRSTGVEAIDPDPTAVIDTASLYLSYHDPILSDLSVVRDVIETAAMDSAVTHISHRAIHGLLDTLDAICRDQRPEIEVLSKCYHSLILTARNPVFVIILSVLLETSQLIKPVLALSQEQFGAIQTAVYSLRKSLSRNDGRGLDRHLLGLCRSLSAAMT